MRNIIVSIPPETFQYILKNSTDRTTRKNEPKYVIYYRHKDNNLGQVVVTLDVLWTAAQNCKFDTYKLKQEFFETFFPSLKSGLVEENINYLWRTYNWKIS